MAIFRVNKNKDYTVMSNYHLRDKNMSFKAKGLLSMMLSLPDDWDYSIKGIVSISKENKTSIQSALKELEENKYLKRTKKQNEKGQFEYIYDIYEKPWTEKPCIENLVTDYPCTENMPQINTNIQNTKKQNTKKSNTNIKREYGEFKNVLLTDDEYKKIEGINALSQIENLSRYIASTGKRYKSHYATILNWDRRDKQKQEEDKYKGMSYREREYYRGQEILDQWTYEGV